MADFEKLLEELHSGKTSIPEDFRSGYVTIIGRPNVGKSTLMNRILGQKIAITSNKPQTTRNRIQTVYTESDRGQIVFVDTPGMHKAKNALGEYMMTAAKSALKDVDVILWLVEPSDFIGGGDKAIAEQLSSTGTPVILVINKTDMVSPEIVAKAINAYKDILDFTDVVPLSAMKGDNVEELLDCIFKLLPIGPAYYDEDTVTDIPMREIVAEIIREKALHALDDEVPHGIAVTVEAMKERPGKNLFYDIEATIICERDSHKGIIIGKGGSMLKKIGSNARYEIEKLTEAHVNLRLFVKVRKDWRENESQVKNFGYNVKDLLK